MAFDEGLAQRVREMTADLVAMSERKMFGGLCFMVDGNMSFGIVGDELMVRVGPERFEDALAHEHAREMDFTGKPMKGMVYVAAAGLSEDEDLWAWLERGLNFAGSLPPKRKATTPTRKRASRRSTSASE
jgi:TfoX/Sxy family transcriptional regulator of competence genes